jgi:cobalt-zinc-cadmium efflux system membrane fusion protein
MTKTRSWMRAAAVALMLSLGAACGAGDGAEGEDAAASADYERGPHRGRMLRDGDFAIEMTIFEDGVPPEFHIYAYRNDQPVDPREVQLIVALTRLGGAGRSVPSSPLKPITSKALAW